MKVPFFTHLREYKAHQKELLGAVEECLHSPRLILGEHVRMFEGQCAKRCGVEYGVGVASGTDALALALRVLGIGQGDEVITVANTAVPTVAAIRMAGATPRFVDIDPETQVMDTQKIEAVITEQTKCIIPVHLFGNAVPMDAVVEIARKHCLCVIEDCAQAFGTNYKEYPVGSFGDIGCFSFYPTKNLGAWGDGGMCVTKSKELTEKLRRLRTYGFGEQYIAQSEGVNSRLDELQAAILLKKLGYIDQDLMRRREIAEQYDRELQGTPFKRAATTEGALHSFHLYVIRCPEREKIRSALEGAGIGTTIHYPMPIHLMPAYTFLGYRRGSLPVTEAVMSEILSLPLFPYLSNEETTYIARSLQET